MTLTQFVDYVRNRHRAASDSNWSDAEIYALITGRANEVLGIIGLLEDTDTSNTSTDGTQAVSWPSDAVRIKQVNYAGEEVEQISFRQWESIKNSSGTTPSGDPYAYVQWNREILFVPIPDTTGDAITIYYEKEHPFIDGSSQTTVDIPSVLHWRLADGVIADMFVKDLNSELASFYEQKWLNVHIPAFRKYKKTMDRGDRFLTVRDVDSAPRRDTGFNW